MLLDADPIRACAQGQLFDEDADEMTRIDYGVDSEGASPLSPLEPQGAPAGPADC